MHGISAHSAMAIKRQRRRRGDVKAGKARQSDISRQASMSNKVMGTITMFHVGAVFLTVGLFLMLASVITNETNQAEIVELIGSGVVCLLIGLFLVILNRFYGQREEEELQNYVETRLARTRSGQRLYHDSDSYPEQLDANCSTTQSMESGLSNDYTNIGKKKKGKKSKHIASTVSVINEHNHHQKNKSRGPSSSGGGIEEISPTGVTLERISEEENRARQNPPYHGNNEDPNGMSRGGNLYRVKMIGAMPAICVGRDGKKVDGSIGFIGRPHKLSLHFRPPLTHHQVTPTPSPVNSPPGQYQIQRETSTHRYARIFLSKRCIFQLSVLAPLVGSILLFIGLVQLTPGAEASSFGIPLIVAGSGAFILGLVVIAIRICFKWELNRINGRRTDVPQIKVNEPSCTDPDAEKGLLTTNVPSNNDNVGGAAPDITSNDDMLPKTPTIKEESEKTKSTGDCREETTRLLEDGKNSSSNGGGSYSKSNLINSATPSNDSEGTSKARRSSCIGGGGGKGNSKNV